MFDCALLCVNEIPAYSHCTVADMRSPFVVLVEMSYESGPLVSCVCVCVHVCVHVCVTFEQLQKSESQSESHTHIFSLFSLPTSRDPVSHTP